MGFQGLQSDSGDEVRFASLESLKVVGVWRGLGFRGLGFRGLGLLACLIAEEY